MRIDLHVFELLNYFEMLNCHYKHGTNLGGLEQLPNDCIFKHCTNIALLIKKTIY